LTITTKCVSEVNTVEKSANQQPAESTTCTSPSIADSGVWCHGPWTNSWGTKM